MDQQVDNTIQPVSPIGPNRILDQGFFQLLNDPPRKSKDSWIQNKEKSDTIKHALIPLYFHDQFLPRNSIIGSPEIRATLHQEAKSLKARRRSDHIKRNSA